MKGLEVLNETAGVMNMALVLSHSNGSGKGIKWEISEVNR
jgi:hypothetical protein